MCKNSFKLYIYVLTIISIYSDDILGSNMRCPASKRFVEVNLMHDGLVTCCRVC